MQAQHHSVKLHNAPLVRLSADSTNGLSYVFSAFFLCLVCHVWFQHPFPALWAELQFETEEVWISLFQIDDFGFLRADFQPQPFFQPHCRCGKYSFCITAAFTKQLEVVRIPYNENLFHVACPTEILVAGYLMCVICFGWKRFPLAGNPPIQLI